MRILLLHNYYKERGGEDVVVEQEKALLESRGHLVNFFAQNNSSISGFVSRIGTGFRTVYSSESQKRIETEIGSFHPDVVHVHNFFPQLSPSVYYACKRLRTPVVQTLHNFRVICPKALLFRDEKPCEACVGKPIAWPGVRNACYRGSYLGTAAIAAMLTTHRLLNTWNTSVDAYIALSEFAKSKFIAGGLPGDRLFVKPNFLMPDPGPGKSAGFGLYVGRLSTEKGIETLLMAWRQLKKRKLKIIGDGPLRSRVQELIKGHREGADIEFLGARSGQEVLDFIGQAAFLVVPSECYENFPRVIVEAFSRGVPVLTSRIGSTEEIVRENCTGVFFRPGDANDLACKAEWMFDKSEELRRMSTAARNEYLTKYTAERNHGYLMNIYSRALEHCKYSHFGSTPQPSSVSGLNSVSSGSVE